MTGPELSSAGREARELVLGYVNFSSGPADPKLLSALDLIFNELNCAEIDPVWEPLSQSLFAGLEELTASKSAFQDTQQARAVLTCVFEHTIPAYLAFHRDLLHRFGGNGSLVDLGFRILCSQCIYPG